MRNNYDKIANCYDRFSRMIFFKSQVNAQVHQLHYIPEKARVLIVGGGTGWILEEIAKIHPSGLQLVYVEISAKMMELSKHRDTARNTVEFVNEGIEEFAEHITFDVICTPFLFDNFSKERATMVFQQLNGMLKDKGLWLHNDFSLEAGKGKWWKSLFLTMMYQFFRFFGNVEATALENMNPYFKEKGYQLLEEKYYYREFIQSVVYQK